jgi:hypothetical protein
VSVAAVDPSVRAPEPEAPLAWEARNRTWAGVVAIVAGVLTIAGAVITAIALSDKPSVTAFDALRDATGARAANDGLKAASVLYVHDKAAALTFGQALTALSGLLSALALVYLYRAIRARREGFGQLGLIALAIGGVLSFVGGLVPQIAVDVTSARFASAADHSTLAAHDAIQPPVALAGALIGYIGTLALAVGFLVVAVNGMRLGLLTRFMGTLGIIAGVLWVLPIVSLPIVQAFWLITLGVLFLRLIPQAVPPAWRSGRAEPWPSRQEQVAARQEQLEARRAANVAKRASDGEVVGGEVAGDEGDGPSATPPARSKKKRRRR